MRFILSVVLFIAAAFVASTHAVLNADVGVGSSSGSGGYRYNGPAHKYLPPTTSNLDHQQQQQQQSAYHGPSHRYLPSPLPVVAEPAKPQQSLSAAYEYKSPNAASYAAYKGPYSMQHYQPQRESSNSIAKEHDQLQSSYDSYYVPQQPGSGSLDQRDSYYVPLSYNQYKPQTHAGYAYAPTSQYETGYRYESPATNTVAASTGYHYRAPAGVASPSVSPAATLSPQAQQQLSTTNHGHFQSEPIIANYATPGAGSVGAHAGQTFSFSDHASRPASYQHNLGTALTATTAADAEYLQMQSHSYQLPSYYTMQREWPQQQQQHQHQQHKEALQQHSNVGVAHLPEQETYQVYPVGAGSAYASPSLEFLPPYY